MEFTGASSSPATGGDAFPAVADAAAVEQEKFIGVKLAPYNPTNLDAVHIALDMLGLQSSDVFYDLGCGDGRLCIEVHAAVACCLCKPPLTSTVRAGIRQMWCDGIGS